MMKLPEQAEPVKRDFIFANRDDTAIAPQACWCLDPQSTGTSHWWCEMGRELVNTGYGCTP